MAFVGKENSPSDCRGYFELKKRIIEQLVRERGLDQY
jgi:hypothetical protein